MPATRSAAASTAGMGAAVAKNETADSDDAEECAAYAFFVLNCI